MRPDVEGLRSASPTFTTPDGRSHSMIEAVSRFRDDPETGVRAAEMCFRAFEWGQAAREDGRRPISALTGPRSHPHPGPRAGRPRCRV